MYHQKNEKVKEICHIQWKDANKRIDPCGTCKLMRPCIMDAVIVPGIQSFNKWIDGINNAANNLGD